MRGDRFASSDLTFEDIDLLADLQTWSADDGSASLQGDEAVDGVACHVLELVPTRRDLSYAKIRLWIGRDDLVWRRIELIGGDGNAAKRLRQSKIERVRAIPVGMRMDVETLGAGSRSEIELSEVRFDEGLSEDSLTLGHLERGDW